MELSLQEELRQKPEATQHYAKIIDKIIRFHGAWVDREADVIVWDGEVYQKEGGIAVLEEMVRFQTTPESKQKWQENLDYWRVNYDSIRKHVYKCDD